MKKLCFLIICLPVLLFALPVKTEAQLCGQYYIRIKVRDAAGKPVKNAVVELTPLEMDEARGKQFVRDASDASLFSINYPEGYSFTSFHQLTITANGFKTATNKARFTSCASRDVTVKLAPKESDQEAVWQFQTNIDVRVIGEDPRKELDNVKLTIFEREKTLESFEMKFGMSYFDIQSGIYTFRFEKEGYQTKEVTVEMTALAGKHLKVQLEKREN